MTFTHRKLKSGLHDSSYPDLIRTLKNGSYMSDIDSVFYDYLSDSTTTLTLIVDAKHPNQDIISYDDIRCECKSALIMQRDLSNREQIPFIIALTWTKDDNDPHLDHEKGPKMLYLIPGNYFAVRAMKAVNNTDMWYTPRTFARLVNALKVKPKRLTELDLIHLSNERKEYAIKTEIDFDSISRNCLPRRAA